MAAGEEKWSAETEQHEKISSTIMHQILLYIEQMG
jgi:hypothetical protein